MYHDQFELLTKYQKTKWFFTVIFIYSIQVFCLVVLAYAYMKDYYYSSNYVLNSGWIIFEEPLHFACVVASVMVLFSYLTSSILQSVKLFCSCLNLIKTKTSTLYKYGIIMSTLNMLLILSTWSISLVVINHSLYNVTESPQDVVLNSVANVFILEIDDYMCGYFKTTFQFDPKDFDPDEPWTVQVNKRQFKRSTLYHNQFFVCLLLVWVIMWALASGEFYSDFQEATVGAIRTLVIVQLAFIAFLGVCQLFAPLAKGGKKVITLSWIFGCFMNLFFYVMNLFVAGGTPIGFPIYECWNTEGLTYCIIHHFCMGIAIVLFIFMIWNERKILCGKGGFGDDESGSINKYLLIVYEILSFIGMVIWRIQSPDYNEGCYVIGVIYGTVYLKYYGGIVFTIS